MQPIYPLPHALTRKTLKIRKRKVPITCRTDTCQPRRPPLKLTTYTIWLQRPIAITPQPSLHSTMWLSKNKTRLLLPAHIGETGKLPSMVQTIPFTQITGLIRLTIEIPAWNTPQHTLMSFPLGSNRPWPLSSQPLYSFLQHASTNGPRLPCHTTNSKVPFKIAKYIRQVIWLMKNILLQTVNDQALSMRQNKPFWKWRTIYTERCRPCATPL